MATRSVFEVGNKITMQLIKRANVFSMKGIDRTTYTSQLLHVVSEKELTITVPIYKNKLLGLALGDIYFVRFYTKNGLYQCKCVIHKSGMEGNIATVNVKMISNLDRYQRREYYRLECRVPVKYAKLNEYQRKLYNDLKNSITSARRRLVKEQLQIEEIQYGKGLMLDISGGGMKFNSYDKFEKDDLLVMMPDMPPISDELPFFIGTVILTKQVGFKKAAYENKIKFLDISNAEREKIITYIFAIEREKMKDE